MKLVTKQIAGFFVLRTKSFFSPFSPFFCSSNRRRIQPTLFGFFKALCMVSSWLDAVVHWTSRRVNAYAFPNRLRWCEWIGWFVEFVCIHSMPLHPAYRLHRVQFARAASIQQSSAWVAADCAIYLCISRVNGSRLLGTDSHRFCSSRTFAMAGANLVSAVDRNLGSTSRYRPRNFATSSK